MIVFFHYLFFLILLFYFYTCIYFFPCEIYSVVGEFFFSFFFSYARLKVAAWCPSKCKEHQLFRSVMGAKNLLDGRFTCF